MSAGTCPACGGDLIPETWRGVEHLICGDCSECDVCDATPAPSGEAAEPTPQAADDRDGGAS